MQELEKILEEIEAEFDRRINTQLKIMAGLGDDVYRYGYGKSLEAYQQGKLFVEDIIRKHLSRENATEIARCSRDTEGAEPEINLAKEEFEMIRFSDSVTFRCGNEYVSLYMGEDEATREYKHMNDGWIPVEERLPNHLLDCEVTLRNGSRSIARYVKSDGCWVDHNDFFPNVIAWKESSEPYRPERSD